MVYIKILQTKNSFINFIYTVFIHLYKIYIWIVQIIGRKKGSVEMILDKNLKRQDNLYTYFAIM